MFGIHLHFFLFINFINIFPYSYCTVPQLQLCADPMCSEPISEAQGLLTYSPQENSVLGFKKGTKMIILSKSNEQKGYWRAKIGSRIGFVPSTHLKEIRVFKNSNSLIPVQQSILSVKSEESKGLEQNNLNEINLASSEFKNRYTSENVKITPTVSVQKDVSNVKSDNGSPLAIKKLKENKLEEIKLNSKQNEIIPKESIKISEIHNLNDLGNSKADIKSEADFKKDVKNHEEAYDGIDDDEEDDDDDGDDDDDDGDDDDDNDDNDVEVDVEVDVNVAGDEDKDKKENEGPTDNVKNQKSENIDKAEDALGDSKIINITSKDEKIFENNNDKVQILNLNKEEKVLNNMNKINQNVEHLKKDNLNILSITQPGNSEINKVQFEKSIEILNSNKHLEEDVDYKKNKLNENIGSDMNFEASNLKNIILGPNQNYAKENNLENFKSDDSDIKESNIISNNYNETDNRISDSNFNENVTNDDIEVIVSNVNNNDKQNFVNSLEENNSSTLQEPVQFNNNSENNVNENHTYMNGSLKIEQTNNTPELSLKNSKVLNEHLLQVSNENLGPIVSANAEENEDLDDMKGAENILKNNLPTNDHKTMNENQSVETIDDIVSGTNTNNISDKKLEEVILVNDREGIFEKNLNKPDTDDSSSYSDPNDRNMNIIQKSDYEKDINFKHINNAEQLPLNKNNLEQSIQSDYPSEEIIKENNVFNVNNVPSSVAIDFLTNQVAAEELNEIHSEIVNSNGENLSEIKSDNEIINEVSEGPVENLNLETTTQFPEYKSVDEEKTDEFINEHEKDSENGFFSKLSSTVLNWFAFGQENDEKSVLFNQDEVFEEVLINNQVTSEGEKVVDRGRCEIDNSELNCEETFFSKKTGYFWNFWTSNNKNLDFNSSSNTFIYLVVTAVTVLLFTLGYYFIEKFHSDRPLIAKVNRLEHELLVASKECNILRDELQNTKDKLNLFETSSNDRIITALQLELEESKKIRGELENNIEVLQQELDAATEAGLDLNRMLSEVLTQKGGSESLMESVEHLQTQLNNQQKIIDEMTSKLVSKTEENQELQNELEAANEKIESLGAEVEDLRGNLNVHLKDNEDVVNELTTKNNQLEIKINQLNENKEKEISKLKTNLIELKEKLKISANSLKIKEEEYNNLKDSVKKIKLKDNKSIDSLFNVTRIKAEFVQIQSENNSLKESLKSEQERVKELINRLEIVEDEIQKVKLNANEAEKEKVEAQTRLEVLSNYFKEKETQLQKELGLREAMWVQKQGDDSTVYERMKSMEEEIETYKSQNEALKKEILDQERGLKAQIATLEKKAHENWIAARQAERKLEESKQEAAQLRNKLTFVEKNINNDLEANPHHRMNEEINGGEALSPLLHDTSSPILFPPPLPLDPNNSSLIPPVFIPPPMFMPPPPGGFMPPPPPFLPGDHRPPPLGRMSSPPLNNRFSPPPPDYPYDRMSTPPMSPSNRNYRSPNESERDRDRDRDRFIHRTPTSPSFRSRNWEEGSSSGMTGFRPINSERDSRREQKGGSNLSSGHSSDSLDKSSRHSGRI